VNIRHTLPTIRDDTREMLEKQAQYQIARQRAIHLDNESDEITNLIPVLLNGLDRHLHLPIKSIPYDLSDLIQKIRQQPPITTKNFDEKDCDMIIQILQENMTKGSCTIALQICLQSSLNEYNLHKIDKRQLILYSTSRVKHLVQPFIQQIGGWETLAKPKRMAPIDLANLPNLTEWQQQMPNNQMSKVMMLITLIMSLLRPIQGIEVYDCVKPKFGRIFSLLDTHECLYNSPSNITSHNVTYFIYQEAEFYRTTIRECRVRMASMSFHCGWQSYSSIVGQKAIPRPVIVTVNDCEKAFQLHRIIMEDGTTIEVKPNTISRRTTMDRNTKSDGTCKGVTKIINGQTQSDIVEVKDYEVELLEYEGNFDIKTGLLLSNSKCKMSRDFCATNEAVLLYTANTKGCTLRFLKRTLFIIIQGRTFLPTKKEYLIMPREADRKRLRSEETHEENTPTIMITANQKEMIRLIRQTQQVKCKGVVYDTN